MKSAKSSTVHFHGTLAQISFSLVIISLALDLVNNQFVSKNVLSHFSHLVHFSITQPASHHSNASKGVVHSHSKAFITAVSFTHISHPFKNGASLGYFSANFSTLQTDFINLANVGYLVAHSAHLASQTHGIKLDATVTHKSSTILGI
jgi:hypothetical protein